jgi:PKD repeat protein
LIVDVIAVKTRGPSAGFDFKILTTKPPFEVKFTNKSKNAEKFSWNFGDLKSGINNLSILESPDHEFKTGGNYNVLLTVGNRVSKTSDSIMKVIKLSSGNAQDVQKFKKQKNIWLGSAIATAAIGGFCVIEYNSVYNDWKEKGTDKLKQKYNTFKTAGVVALVGSGVCITQVIIKSHKLKQAKIATGVSFIPLDKGGIVALAWTF